MGVILILGIYLKRLGRELSVPKKLKPKEVTLSLCFNSRKSQVKHNESLSETIL